MYNERDFLTSSHKITLDGLTFHKKTMNQLKKKKKHKQNEPDYKIIWSSLLMHFHKLVNLGGSGCL